MSEAKDLVGSVSATQERGQVEQIGRMLERDYRRYPHPISEEGLT